MRTASYLQIASGLLALMPGARAQIDEARPPGDRSTQPESIIEQGSTQAPGSLQVLARCSDVKLGTGVRRVHLGILNYRSSGATHRHFDVQGRLPNGAF